MPLSKARDGVLALPMLCTDGRTIAVPSRKLEITVALIVGTLAVSAGAVFMTRHPSVSRFDLAPGARLPDPQGYHWSSHERTLVLVLRVGCPYCERNKDFYERLSSLERSSALGAHVLAMFPDPRQAVESTGMARWFSGQMLFGVNLSAMGVGGTPTLLLLDGSGTVRDMWPGELSKAQQNWIIHAIRNSLQERGH